MPGLPVYVWAGAGSVWLGLESGTRVARVDPATGRVRLVEAGDGASGFASDGRERLDRLAPRQLAHARRRRDGPLDAVATALTPVETTAAERIAYARGALWITGRGLDLLRVDPATGAITRPSRSGPAGSRCSQPARASSSRRRRRAARAAAIRSSARSSPSTPRPPAPRPERRRAAFANGLVLIGATAWSADTVNGRLIRIALAR